jgi:hypothetical protein
MVGPPPPSLPFHGGYAGFGLTPTGSPNLNVAPVPVPTPLTAAPHNASAKRRSADKRHQFQVHRNMEPMVGPSAVHAVPLLERVKTLMDQQTLQPRHRPVLQAVLESLLQSHCFGIEQLAQHVAADGHLDVTACARLAEQAQQPLGLALEVLGYVALANDSESSLKPTQVATAPQPQLDIDMLLTIGKKIPSTPPPAPPEQPYPRKRARTAAAPTALYRPDSTPKARDKRLNACAEKYAQVSDTTPGNTPLQRTLNKLFDQCKTNDKAPFIATAHACPAPTDYASLVYQILVEAFAGGYLHHTLDQRTLHAQDMAHLAHQVGEFATAAQASGAAVMAAGHTQDLGAALLAQFQAFGIQHLPTLAGIRRQLYLAEIPTSNAAALLMDFSRAVNSYATSTTPTSLELVPGEPVQLAKKLLQQPDNQRFTENVNALIADFPGSEPLHRFTQLHLAWYAYEQSLRS